MSKTKELEQVLALDQYRAMLLEMYRVDRNGDQVVIADVFIKPETGRGDLLEFRLDSWPEPDIPEDTMVLLVEPTVRVRTVDGVIAPDSIEWRASTLVAVAE
ncbi:hypothetical protein HUO13_01175 [Saccharopolyspora erythraea]|uniref:hypothetical protein n=1 Tax=Saccharopolyspora erythraea TaxID=1836 RepID=UPI001BA5AD85|nr:hypothetical protein [Saccharopolyspora erythraea]QUG99594.1 hypothetical protein HUO13_01175 [Saccharopolyspora erythraea]